MIISSRHNAVSAGRWARRWLLFGATLVLVLTAFNHLRLLSDGRHVGVLFASRRDPQPPLSVVVLETRGCHDEVTTSFFSALGLMKGVTVHAFLDKERFGIDKIYERLPGVEKRNITSVNDFTVETIDRIKPDVIFTITTDRDLVRDGIKDVLGHLFADTTAVVFSVIHSPIAMKSQGIFELYQPWLEARRMRLITLSEHVTDYLGDYIFHKYWAMHTHLRSIPVSTFPPVFSVPGIDDVDLQGLDPDLPRFTMQGDLLKDRSPNRDYKGTLDRLAEVIAAEKEATPFELVVLGDGALPDIPESIRDKVKFKTSLPYMEFYGVMHSATALLPAFATPDYVKIRASSTIGASLIAGCPLVADRALLDAYRFLDEDDVYLRADGEDEMGAAVRIAKLPLGERRRKSEGLRAKNERLVRENARKLQGWMWESLRWQRYSTSPLLLFSYEFPRHNPSA